MIGHRAPRLVVPAVAVALLVALTGCGKVAAAQGSGTSAGPATVQSSSSGAGATASTPAADDSATLDSISRDLDAATTANTEADSNTASGDQAAAASVEP